MVFIKRVGKHFKSVLCLPVCLTTFVERMFMSVLQSVCLTLAIVIALFDAGNAEILGNSCWIYVNEINVCIIILGLGMKKCYGNEPQIFNDINVWSIILGLRVNKYSETCLEWPPLERPPCLERPLSSLRKILSSTGFHANWTGLERPPVL